MRFRTLIGIGLVSTGLVTMGCTAEVEDKGEAPAVDVDPGRMPEVDVDPSKVEISSDTQQVVTPEVKVTPTEGDDPDTDTTAKQ